MKHVADFAYSSPKDSIGKFIFRHRWVSPFGQPRIYPNDLILECQNHMYVI